MSNSRDLLKEAIADAKSVKEAAIANAKAALEEAFTPYLQEKFAAKLAEMEMEEEKMEEAEMTDENYSEDGNMDERLGTINDPSEEGVGNAFSASPKGNLEEEDDDLNLEELLAELGEEMETEGMKEKTEESLTEQEEEEEMEMDSEEEVEGEDEEIDLEDMSEEDLKSLIEDVIADMVAAGELEAGENFEAEEEGDEEEDIDIDMEDEEEDMVAERKHYGGNKGDKPRKSTAKEKDELLKEEETMMDEGMMDKLNKVIQRMKDNAAAGRPLIDDEMFSFVDKADLLPPGLVSKGMEKSGSGPTSSVGEAEVEEMKDQIEELASTLSEVKLLNAKLLYTNKIFRAKNLTENQKVKVLEAFDKAASVKDAKLIYETLTAVKETKAPVTESMRGMASKAAGMAPEKKPILEVNNQFARWQVLAGIKK